MSVSSRQILGSDASDAGRVLYDAGGVYRRAIRRAASSLCGGRSASVSRQGGSELGGGAALRVYTAADTVHTGQRCASAALSGDARDMSCHMMRQIEETDARTARVAAELADFGYSIYTASVVVLV